MSKRKFYITTPIYYVNDVPHIGHAYTTVAADVLARYHRLFGDEVKFLTGVDEHGQKVQQVTAQNGREPQSYVDEMSERFRRVWGELNIQHDVFFRTTDPVHVRTVQGALQELWDKGEIYSEDYEGLYCVSEEIFYTEKDLVNGKTPQGNEVVPLREKSYFFRMSKYQTALIDYIEKNLGFIQPDFRRNEVLGFLRKPLHDLCISRPKSRLNWGIELPFAPDYVCYVWFDALLNYATAMGYREPARAEEFRSWWNEVGPIHLLGKDILTTHAVYWPTMLMALGLGLPRTIFAHGWWLTDSGEKMSKSKGKVVRPLELKEVVGVDSLRYFLTRDITLGADAAFSPELVVARINADLANNLGNLLSRVTNLVDKNLGGVAPPFPFELAPESKAIISNLEGLAERVRRRVEALDPKEATTQVLDMLNEANKYVGSREPWKQVKADIPAAAETLAVCLEVLRVAGILWSPIMPSKCADLLNAIGCGGELSFTDACRVPGMPAGATVHKAEPLFPRIDWKVEGNQ